MSVFQHASVNVTRINQLAIVTTIQGSDPSLKPLMLTSHIDTVPVPLDTLDRWDYPPWSGHYDKTSGFLYSRGACDCKG